MAKKKDQGNENLVNVGEALSRTEQFIEDNKNLLTWVATGIAVIILGIFAYNRYIKFPKDVDAHSQAFMAEKFFEQDSMELARYGDGVNLGFEDLLADYKSTPSGNASKYYLGIIAYRNGEYEDAIDYMKSFDSDDILVSTMAVGVIGDAYMQLGEYESGLDYYERAASKNENKITAPVFLKKAGMTCELLGDYDRAIGFYQKIDDIYPETTEGRDIKKYITRAARLGAE